MEKVLNQRKYEISLISSHLIAIITKYVRKLVIYGRNKGGWSAAKPLKCPIICLK